jgi:hypothetical protein
MYRRLPPALPIAQAIEGAPALAQLAGQVERSSAMLRDLGVLIPAGLQVHAGPCQDGQWSLLVRNSAVAAKLRQLTPALLERLRARGWPVERIRIKVLGSP